MKLKNIKFLGLFLILTLPFQSNAQLLNNNKNLEDPASWQYNPSKKEANVGETIELIFTATIDKDWYLYSTDFDPNLGPQVTEFAFKKNNSYELIGGIQPINPKKKYSDIFEGDYTYFTGTGQFKQKVKILKPNPKIDVEIYYQVCNDVSGKCIPFTKNFAFNTIKGIEKVKEDTQVKNDDEKSEENEEETSPEDDKIDSTENIAEIEEKNDTNKVAEVSENTTKEITTNQNDDSLASKGLLEFMGLAFLAGLVALLTPCVFPMIPMTVSFFTKQSKSKSQGIRNAIIYGVSIILIYTLLGTIVSLVYGPSFNNWLSTHWLPNLFFFGLLLVFALSFLGMFELVLPNSWVNKIDKQADKGGLYGIFFMAFTLALVSFSCTAPIVGSILVLSSGGQVLKPVLGMIAFSSAVALPFTLFAIFPSWLQNLPKSGGWLNSVKVVLGFLELAFAFKFLSQADLVYGWGILDREVFLALWIVIFAMLGFYLLGKIRFPHDSPADRVPVPRVMLSLLSFAFVVYMIPGMIGAPLQPLAGYLPPQTTQDFNLYNLTLNNSTPVVSTSNNENNTEEIDMSQVKYGDKFHLPFNLKGFFDYEEGLTYAQKVNKPILLDFTGHGCANCRKMEEYVWNKPDVMKILRNNYVMIALYVDDRTTLPENEQVKSTVDGELKTTIGAKNIDFEIANFNNNAQPYYCLLDHNGELLTEPFAYDPNPENFVKFLEKGKEEFEKRQKKIVKK